jgi:hypothetical protein
LINGYPYIPFNVRIKTILATQFILDPVADVYSVLYLSGFCSLNNYDKISLDTGFQVARQKVTRGLEMDFSI